MMISGIVLVLSFFLDGILSNFLPYMVGDLSLFTPMFTVVSLVIVYPFFKKKLKNYFISCFILGLVYDFVYTNLLFYNAILFLAIGILVIFLYRYIRLTWISLILFVVVAISGYECLNAIIIIAFQLVPMTFYRLLYKISHSILLNICYAELVYFIIWLLPMRYKKVAINSQESRIFTFFFSYPLIEETGIWIQRKL